MSQSLKCLLSLCDFTGNWSNPYKDSGYDVVKVDIKYGIDVRLMEYVDRPVHGILAAPPCTVFCKAATWNWENVSNDELSLHLSVVDACLRAVAIYRPVFWALENPVGRLRRWLGPPAFKFNPSDFGDPWTKKTLLWGNFVPPTPLFSKQANNSVYPYMGDITTKSSSSQKVKRAATPRGFAKAFFEANP